jgi:hypothetical protein
MNKRTLGIAAMVILIVLVLLHGERLVEMTCDACWKLSDKIMGAS